MTFCKDPITLHSSCNCAAIRYTVSVPISQSVPQTIPHARFRRGRSTHPYVRHLLLQRLPPRNGTILPMAVVTVLSTVSVQCKLGTSSGEAGSQWRPAVEGFDHKDAVFLNETSLAHYESSKGRTAWVLWSLWD